ncbi:DNA primase family protein [Dysgonomonas termitidis]|uniref:Phage/plasmid primase, P4 family n=1 Tax=Dysgonomonas termitidis TaxID=1516126 RepID=A0ABV9L1T7_9BACT
MTGTIDGLRAHISNLVLSANEQRKVTNKGKPCQSVLSGLLNQIKRVDFREKAGLDTDEKISRKLYVVIAIDNILDIAVANKWGLCTKDGFIYVFNSKYWQAISADDFKPFLAEAAMKMGVPELEAKYHLFRDELYKQFLSVSNLPTLEIKRTVLVNLLNGTFEITDKRQVLREPDRKDFLKYQLPFEYDANAECPLFDKYLNRVLKDEDCRKVLAEYLGYIFVNSLKLEKALILYGSGANGKSVFFEIVNAILGDENICSYSLQNLTKYDSYQRAELSNKLLNYASEINGKLEASIFKQLVSGEPVEARQIYGKPFIMREYGKLMFNCNELPKEVEQTNAFFRRFIIIPFSETIPEHEQDPELAKKIIDTELSGVFNWILDGLERILQQKKFTQSALVKDQIDTYRKESDNVAMFIDEENYTQTNGNPNVLLKTIYDGYKMYAVENGYKVCSIRSVSERIKMLGFTTEKTRNGIIVYAKK